MYEDPNCNLCQLSETHPANPCLRGLGNPDTAKLVVYLQAPSFTDDVRGKPLVSDGAELLKNLFGRMSINIATDVYFDYVLKCYAGKKMPGAKAERLACYEACSLYRFATLQDIPNLGGVVVMGKLAIEALLGVSEMKDYEGECWTPREIGMRQFVSQVWVTYDPAYLIEKPAEIPNVYRILFTAAKQAGLEPKPNLNHPHFDHES